MKFELFFSEKANEHLTVLEKTKSKAKLLKAVRKTLGLMESNLRHPSLNTHQYDDFPGAEGEKIFESYTACG